MKSKGLVVLYTLSQLSSSRNLSASCTRSTRIERSKLPSSRSPSFLEISSLLKLFSQKVTTELPDKKMPNPHQPLGAGCVVRVDSRERPLRVCAFFMTAGKVSMALKSSMCRPYISLEMFSVII